MNPVVQLRLKCHIVRGVEWALEWGVMPAVVVHAVCVMVISPLIVPGICNSATSVCYYKAVLSVM